MKTFSVITCLLVSDLCCGLSRAKEQRELNRFWKHLQIEKHGLTAEYLFFEVDRYNDMENCIETALSDLKPTSDTFMQPRVVDTLADNLNRTILVEISNAISPTQAKAIEQLASCTRLYMKSSRFEQREFGETTGGNDCTYINILLQLFLPEVYKNVVAVTEMAYKAAGWDKTNIMVPSKCGLRTSEHLKYDSFRSLGDHADTGSLFTTLIALSDPKTYQGGEFYIRSGDDYYFKPRQYSALVFLSDRDHGVTDLNGPREMFTNEFWVYEDPPWSQSMRPGNEGMDTFVRRIDEHNEQLGGGGEYLKVEDMNMEKMWPHEDEIVEFDEYDEYGYGFYYEDDDDSEQVSAQGYQASAEESMNGEPNDKCFHCGSETSYA